jgi:Flp pilus assembly protein TadG
MKRPGPNVTPRRGGSVIMLMALLAVPLLGMLAFCIDLGYLHNVKDECQNVADSASLAGVAKLADYTSFSGTSDSSLRQTLQNKAVAAARAEAKKYVTANTAGGVTLQIDDTADIKVGYWNSTAKTFTATSVPDNNWPNAVQVTTRRDDTSLPKSNGSVGLFFGPVIGLKKSPVAATATAALNSTNPSVSGLGDNLSTISVGGLLPFAVDVDAYMYYLQHGTTGPGASTIDNYGVPNGTTPNVGADGIPEFQVYPPPSQIHPSQKGLLSFDGPVNALYSGGPTSKFGGNGNTISDWIDPGPSGSELMTNFGTKGFQPPLDVYGTPGNKTGHFDDLTGETRLLPLTDYSQTTDGNHGTYHIVGAVAVKIVYGPDSNGIYSQPVHVPIPSAISGTSPSSGYTYNPSSFGGTGTSLSVPVFDPTVVPAGYRAYQLVQ